MSGTGKSSVIRALAGRGHKAVDTDWNSDWEVPPPAGDRAADGQGWLWREDRIKELLDTEDAEALFVSSCVPNQSRFYKRFDRIVLLSASRELTVQRLSGRTNNPYGRSAAEVDEVLHLKATVEPLLRSIATDEIDTDRPLDEVVANVLELAESR